MDEDEYESMIFTQQFSIIGHLLWMFRSHQKESLSEASSASKIYSRNVQAKTGAHVCDGGLGTTTFVISDIIHEERITQ